MNVKKNSIFFFSITAKMTALKKITEHSWYNLFTTNESNKKICPCKKQNQTKRKQKQKQIKTR